MRSTVDRGSAAGPGLSARLQDYRSATFSSPMATRPQTRAAISASFPDHAMVADRGPTLDDDKEPPAHAKRTPTKPQTPSQSSKEPKVKIETPSPASARRHDSPMPRSPLQHTRRDEVAMHGSRPGAATSRDKSQLQQMSLQELINLRKAERDTTNELDKTQRRLERLSHRM